MKARPCVHTAISPPSPGQGHWKAAASSRKWTPSATSAKPSTAFLVGRFFFPLDLRLDLRGEDYSPSVLQILEWLGGNLESFQQASESLKVTLDLEVTGRAIENVTEKLGAERAALRDAEVLKFEKGELAPRHVEPPAVGVVTLDGGRAQVRSSDSPPGVHGECWTETKVADFQTYTLVTHERDPQPEPPRDFLNPERVRKLVEELKGAAGPAKKQSKAKADGQKRASEDRKIKMPRPKLKVRTVVATLKCAAEFGRLAATEAALRGFFKALRKAVIGDGSAWIWNLALLQFVGFTLILDFVHLLSYLYAAAHAAHGSDAKKSWKLYEKLLRLAWAGNAAAVISLLEREAHRLGEPPKNAPEKDPRRVVAGALQYIVNNKDKLDYARYRMEGLPISSCQIESRIKQINRRVKGTEKFWTREGLEAVLQVRAASLSDDGRRESFWSRRPAGRARGRNRQNLVKAA